jgi:hypothetical protein
MFELVAFPFMDNVQIEEDSYFDYYESIIESCLDDYFESITETEQIDWSNVDEN